MHIFSVKSTLHLNLFFTVLLKFKHNKHTQYIIIKNEIMTILLYNDKKENGRGRVRIIRIRERGGESERERERGEGQTVEERS